MPGEMVEYYSSTFFPDPWVPGVVQSFDPQTNTYFLNLMLHGNVPQASPKRIRPAEEMEEDDEDDSEEEEKEEKEGEPSGAFVQGDRVEYLTEEGQWIPGVVQRFFPWTNTYWLNLIPHGYVAKAAALKVRAAQGRGFAQLQTFVPGDTVEYRSASLGEWVPGVVKSFDPQTSTYCLKLFSQGDVPKDAHVPKAAPGKIRPLKSGLFKPGAKVEYWSESCGGKWFPGEVQCFNPVTNTYFLNLDNKGQIPRATPAKIRAIDEQDEEDQSYQELLEDEEEEEEQEKNGSGERAEDRGEIEEKKHTPRRSMLLLPLDQGVSTMTRAGWNLSWSWLELDDFVWPEVRKIRKTRTRKCQSRVAFADEKGLPLAEVRYVEEVKKSTHPELFFASAEEALPRLSLGPQPSFVLNHGIVAGQVPQQSSMVKGNLMLPVPRRPHPTPPSVPKSPYQYQSCFPESTRHRIPASPRACA